MVRSKHETIPRQFRFPQETLDQLDALCKNEGGITRSDFLRALITKTYHEVFGKRATLPDPPEMKQGRRTAAARQQKKR
jgi:predicted DNA-binding protein